MIVSKNYRYRGKSWNGVSNGKREVARRLRQIAKGLLCPVHKSAAQGA